MEKIKKIKIAKPEFSFGYLILFVFCLQVLPEIFLSLKMLQNQAGLSEIQVIFIRVLAGIISLPFLYLAISGTLNKRVEKQFCSPKIFGKFVVWLMAWMTGGVMLLITVIQTGEYFRNLAQENNKQYLFVAVLIAIGISLLGMFLFYQMLFQMYEDNEGKGVLKGTGYLLAHPVYLIEMLAFLTLFAGAYVGIPYGFSKINLELSFVSRLEKLLVAAAVESAILYGYMTLTEKSFQSSIQRRTRRREKKEAKHLEMQSNAEEQMKENAEVSAEEYTEKNTEEYAENQKKGKNSKAGLIRYGISLGLAFASLIAVIVTTKVQINKITAQDEILASIDEKILAGEVYLLDGNPDQALVYYKGAAAIADAWTAALNKDDETLLTLREEYPNEEEVYYLYLMTREDTTELENYIRSDAHGYGWYQSLLRRYKQLNENGLNEAQSALQEEALYVCIANGVYQDVNLDLEEIDDKRAIVKELKDYRNVDLYVTLLEQVVNIGHTGILTQEMVDQALEIAEKNRDVFVAQYIAYTLGISYLADDATHYERTVDAINRYDKLFAKEDVSQNQIKVEKLNMADACMKMKDYKKALDYLDEAAALGVGDSVNIMYMQCYTALEENEACYEYAIEVLKKNPQDLAALYYAATESLKQEDLDTSITYAKTLADLVEKTADSYDGEILLYQYAQFMVLKDSSQWTQYQYAQYSKLTEEQWKDIEESPFLEAYLKGLNATFNDKEEEEALAYTDKVLAVNENLPQMNYLKGVIYSNNKQFENAVIYYNKSIALKEDSPNVWFSLANAYDAMENYEMAYQCCKKTAALVPYLDHDSSWYGVAVHNDNLMKSLKNYVDEE